MVSGIIPRKDNLNEKGIDVNNFLNTFCKDFNFNFIDNSNINEVTDLNKSGLHLNIKGKYVLGRNLLHSIRLWAYARMRFFPDSTTSVSTDINGKSSHPEMNEKTEKEKVMNPTDSLEEGKAPIFNIRWFKKQKHWENN